MRYYLCSNNPRLSDLLHHFDETIFHILSENKDLFKEYEKLVQQYLYVNSDYLKKVKNDSDAISTVKSEDEIPSINLDKQIKVYTVLNSMLNDYFYKDLSVINSVDVKSIDLNLLKYHPKRTNRDEFKYRGNNDTKSKVNISSYDLAHY